MKELIDSKIPDVPKSLPSSLYLQWLSRGLFNEENSDLLLQAIAEFENQNQVEVSNQQEA